MIRKEDLGPMQHVGDGAVGVVHSLTTFRFPGSPQLAYKEIKQAGVDDVSETGRRSALTSMAKSVAFRAGLSRSDQDDLDRYTTWPIEMVEDGGAPCGAVMPLLPADFFTTVTSPSGEPDKRVTSLSWLCLTLSNAMSKGLDKASFTDSKVRIALISQLVYAVGRLHRQGLVYGDLSMTNAAFALNPVRVKLLDCDATAAVTDQERKQLHTNFFWPPEMASGTALQDQATDVYKLGVCVIRGLNYGPGVTQAKNPALLTDKLDPRAIEVVARAVGDDPAARPSAAELFDCLERNLMARAGLPVMRAAWIDRGAAVRGTDVRVHWETSGAETVVITGPDGLREPAAGDQHDNGSISLTPLGSGDIRIEAANKNGAVSVVAGDVRLYDLPEFVVNVPDLPVPDVPGVPPVDIPPVVRVLPAAPSVSTANHPVPRPQVPPLDAVAGVLSVVTGSPAPMRRVREAMTAQADGLARIGRQRPRVPDLAAAGAAVACDVHQMLENARQQFKDRVAEDVATGLRQGATP